MRDNYYIMNFDKDAIIRQKRRADKLIPCQLLLAASCTNIMHYLYNMYLQYAHAQ